MSCSVRAVASLVLVGVLLGAPLASVVCAEWCAPGAHADHVQRASGAADCHGDTSGAGARAEAPRAPECLEYVLSSRTSGPIAVRSGFVPIAAVPPAPVVPALSLLAPDLASARFTHPSPPRPPASRPVLRI